MARARSAPIRRALVGFAALALAFAPTALAQAAGTVADVPPRRPHFDPISLRPSQFVYQMTLERDAGSTVLGTRTVTTSIITYAGAPSWLLLEQRVGDRVSHTDSLITDLVALRPLHWSSNIGAARLAAEFRGDTVFGATSAPSGRRSMIGVIPSGSFVSSAMLETVLRLLPLQSTWEDSATTASVTLGSNMLIPTRLAVIGEDRISVPAGTFDCWVVSVRADPGRVLYWVTKQAPIVVRSAMDVPSLGTAQLIYALTRIGR